MSTSPRLRVQGFTGGSFAQNTYLASCEGTGAGILVDAGAGAMQALDAAERQGVRVQSIVLTHAHLDHVDHLAAARERLGVPVLLHADDRELFDAVPAQAEWFGMRMDPLSPPDGELADGERIPVGDCELLVRHTPGHAPGHVILIGEGLALTGDCVFAGSIGRTDLPGGDLQTLMSSIRTHILSLPDDTALHSGHGPETTVGRERVGNPFLTGQFGGSRFA